MRPSPISVLIVGVGSIGERHLRCFQSTGRAAVSFVEINDTLRETISQRYGVCGFADLGDAIEAGQATVAVVATPANRHIEIALRLVAAGIHVLIEKPLSTSVERVERLARVTATLEKTLDQLQNVEAENARLAAENMALRENHEAAGISVDLVLENAALLAQVNDLTEKMEVMHFRMTQMVRRIFGSSSERSPPMRSRASCSGTACD